MPAAYTSPEAAVLTKLFARLLADALNELAYPASLAGAGPASCPAWAWLTCLSCDPVSTVDTSVMLVSSNVRLVLPA
jgi:uncharacterized RDD family membrane protein YckC